MDLLIKNGTIVTAKGSYKADVAVKDGKIAAIGKDLEVSATKVVDAKGKLVLPVLLMFTHIWQCRLAEQYLPTVIFRVLVQQRAAV